MTSLALVDTINRPGSSSVAADYVQFDLVLGTIVSTGFLQQGGRLGDILPPTVTLTPVFPGGTITGGMAEEVGAPFLALPAPRDHDEALRWRSLELYLKKRVLPVDDTERVGAIVVSDGDRWLALEVDAALAGKALTVSTSGPVPARLALDGLVQAAGSGIIGNNSGGGDFVELTVAQAQTLLGVSGGSGTLERSHTSKTAAYTATTSDSVILCDASSGGFT